MDKVVTLLNDTDVKYDLTIDSKKRSTFTLYLSTDMFDTSNMDERTYLEYKQRILTFIVNCRSKVNGIFDEIEEFRYQDYINKEGK